MPRPRKKRLTDLEIEQMEREAQARTAWGMYGAIVRQQNYDREIAGHYEKIRFAGSDKAREEAKEALNKYKDRAMRLQRTQLNIGGAP